MWNMFRTCGRDDQQGEFAGEYIAKNFKRVAILHDGTTYGQGLVDQAEPRDGSSRPQSRCSANPSSSARRIFRRSSPGCGPLMSIWSTGVALYTEASLIVRQMRANGIKAVFMGGDGLTSDEFAAAGGPAVEGALMTFSPDARTPPGGQGRGREDPRPEFRAGRLHALQLCGSGSHQAGR